jgi:hypothetical protein
VPVTASDILRLADNDAQTVYRDLSGLKITLTLCDDGWHVDYNLIDPLCAGGGLPYIIDPRTGTIVSKRYEQ